MTFNKFKPLLLCIESSKAIITIKEGGWFMFTLGFTILGQTGKIFMVGFFWLGVFLVGFFLLLLLGFFFRTGIILSVYIYRVSTARSMQ